MTHYIVLAPISPDSGPLILPAPDGEPPTLIDEAVLFATEAEGLTTEQRIKLLVDKGIIALAPARVVTAAEKASARAVATEPQADDKE